MTAVARAPGADTGPELDKALGAVLSRAWCDDVVVSGSRRLSGGASMETWLAVARRSGHPDEQVVLRRDRPGVPQSSRADEARLLRLVADAGVPVPAVLAVGAQDELGAAYFVSAFLDGDTIPRRLLRDSRFAAARTRVLGQLARALAATHQVPAAAVPFLGPVQDAAALVSSYAGTLQEVGEPSPALELALAWLADHLPGPVLPVLVHGDVRTGNLMVDERGLVAVLDWELAHLGDPREDLGWLCVRSWRFGHDEAPAGGWGSREQLVAAYEEAGGMPVDAVTLLFWEVFGTVKWGVICCAQAAMHLRGQVHSLELAAIGRRLNEAEHDVLALLDGQV